MKRTRRIPVIVDTDPGLDDAIAILAALASAELDVLGLTTVAGNLPIDVTTANALRLVEAVGRYDVPVFRGHAEPLARPPLHCGDVHGPDGLGGGVLPPPKGSAGGEGAVDWMIGAIAARPSGTVSICALGPLTNLADLMTRAPETAGRIRRIVAMGGAVREPGNMTPHAEFNLLADPHAADIVLASGVPVTLVPLDVTRRVRTHRSWIAGIRAADGRSPAIAADLLDAYFGRDMSADDNGRPLHDPCVIAYLLRPDLFRSKRMTLRIETEDPETLGRCIECGPVGGRDVDALLSVDPDGVLAFLMERLIGDRCGEAYGPG